MLFINYLEVKILWLFLTMKRNILKVNVIFFIIKNR